MTVDSQPPTILETPHGAVVLRPASQHDMAGYRALRLESLKNYPAAFGADYETAMQQTDEQWAARLAPDDNRLVMLAEAHGQLIGMTVISRHANLKERHYGYITSVYVGQEWRGARLADALIGACLDWARERKLRLVRLSANITNGAAIRCYTRCGFRAYGVEPESLFVDGVYHDELLMAKRLE